MKKEDAMQGYLDAMREVILILALIKQMKLLSFLF